MKDVMIDIETLGLKANCVVLSIGAVFFDIEKNELGPEYYEVLRFQDQIDTGRSIDSQTLKWWLEKDSKFFKPLLKSNCSTYTTLQEFTQYIQLNGGPCVNVWSNGSIFDIKILEDLLIQNDRRIPWNFWNIMDFRTFKRFVVINDGVNDNPHHALSDAKYQAEYILDAIKGNV